MNFMNFNVICNYWTCSSFCYYFSPKNNIIIIDIVTCSLCVMLMSQLQWKYRTFPGISFMN